MSFVVAVVVVVDVINGIATAFSLRVKFNHSRLLHISHKFHAQITNPTIDTIEYSTREDSMMHKQQKQK